MKEARCPECGNRLDSNYCHMCMKRVPFPAGKEETPWQQKKYTPSPEETHDCIHFDEPEQTKKTPKPNVLTAALQRPKRTQNKKQGIAVAIIVAACAMVSVFAGILGEVIDAWETDTAVPEYSYADYVQAGSPGAEDVPAIEPVELYNAEGILVAVDSAGVYDDEYAVAVTVTNNSDRAVTVTTDYLCVNGCMYTSSSLYAQVEEGGSAQCYLSFYEYDLQTAGIEQVAKIQFCLDIYDADTFDPIDYTELITLETDLAGDYEQPTDDSGWELYDGDGVRILMKEMEMSYGDCLISMYIENNTDKLVNLYAEGISVNGEQIDGVMWENLLPNTRAISSVYLFDLEGDGITDLEQIEELTMELCIEFADAASMEDWNSVLSRNATITFTPAELT